MAVFKKAFQCWSAWIRKVSGLVPHGRCTAHEEPVPGAISGVLSADKGDGMRDRIVDKATALVWSPFIWQDWDHLHWCMESWFQTSKMGLLCHEPRVQGKQAGAWRPLGILRAQVFVYKRNKTNIHTIHSLVAVYTEKLMPCSFFFRECK